MITPLTILRFLFFQRDAIQVVARSRAALGVGFLLVLSAAFAREYDGEYLMAEPWHLALPLLASLIGCTAMVTAVGVAAYSRGIRDVGVVSIFRTFLSLYWMTAPMAWLYAIPVERFLSPADATRANLWLLALVALWRVLLMIRCVQVVCGASIFAASFPVILFSDIVALLALRFIPGPIFMVMGGVRLSDSENLIVGTRVMLGFLGVVSLPIWIIGFLVVCGSGKRWKWFDSSEDLSRQGQSGEAQSDPPVGISIATWLAVAVSLMIWIPLLPKPQAEQAIRWESERLIRARKFKAFSELARTKNREMFPPHWDPPPRIGYGETEPQLFRVAVAVRRHDAPEWIQAIYREKIQRLAYSHQDFWADLQEYSDDELDEFVSMMSQLRNPKAVASHYRAYVKFVLAEQQMTERRRRTLRKLQRLAGGREPESVATPADANRQNEDSTAPAVD